MTISKERQGNSLILSLEGRLDTATAPQLEAEIKNSLSGVDELSLQTQRRSTTYSRARGQA